MDMDSSKVLKRGEVNADFLASSFTTFLDLVGYYTCAIRNDMI